VICNGCKRPIGTTTLPAQVVMLPHRREAITADAIISVRAADVALYCSVECLRDQMTRILEIG
jgi:hypothetical protein